MQLAFDRRAAIDRIITPVGSFLFRERLSTLSPRHLECVIDQITEFFGGELHQFGRAPLEDVTYKTSALDAGMFDALDQRENARSVGQYLRMQAAQHPGTSFEAALYSFRDISVQHPEAYLVAALRGHKLKALANQCGSIEDAIAIVRAISGEESIFHDPDRLSLPDEVILFQTGSERDKAFLLFSLVQLATKLPDSIRNDSELLCADRDTWVRFGSDWFDASSWEKSPVRRDAAPVFRLSANPPATLDDG